MPYDVTIGRNDADKKTFGDKGLIYIGKGYVKMGQYTSLSNPILMDIARSHVIMIAGKRGSGKSYTLGTIAEQLSLLPKEIADNIASLIFDTMGIFWTMKYKNEKEKELLQSWKEKPAEIPVKIFVPFGFYDEAEKAGIPVDKKFSIMPSELAPEDWVLTFNLNLTDPTAVLIERIITKLNQLGKNYEIKDILFEIQQDSTSSQESKNACLGLFEAASTWGVFSSTGTEIGELISAGTTSILDLSVYNSVGAFNVRALVIGLISRKLFNKRQEARKKEELESVRHGLDYMNIGKRKIPLVWIFIDEIHEFIPDVGKTAATDALIQLLREGRQPGISIVMATQQPGALARDAITQSDIVISHRITAAPDINALNNMMQSYLLDSIKKYLDDLPNLKGSAIILDDNSERIYPMRIKPRLTWHGGEAPTAVKVEKRE